MVVWIHILYHFGLFKKQTPHPLFWGWGGQLTLGNRAAISVTATQIFSEHGRKLQERKQDDEYLKLPDLLHICVVGPEMQAWEMY